jgi:hypothetical protein
MKKKIKYKIHKLYLEYSHVTFRGQDRALFLFYIFITKNILISKMQKINNPLVIFEQSDYIDRIHFCYIKSLTKI